jgi:hypothetical protein
MIRAVGKFQGFGPPACGPSAMVALAASLGRFSLLTESEVQRSFRNLFKSKEFGEDTFEKAEALLEELRAESPLRHRLSVELEEIRKMQTAKS